MGILEMMALRFNMQRDDTFERTNDKCHVFTL